MMGKEPNKIAKKIVGWSVVAPEDNQQTGQPGSGKEGKSIVSTAQPIKMPPLLKRPDELEGSTYKIKTPNSEHALYITINDVVIDNGMASEHRRPFEIFINSKNMENFAWIVALTRVISAVFRQGGDVTFLADELRSVFDPRGGYYKRGGRYMPSLVAEIGECIEAHLIKIGMIQRLEPTEELKSKREKAEADGIKGGNQCPKCGQMALVLMDGCETCLECGHSKCG